jgi:hypothetical protein
MNTTDATAKQVPLPQVLDFEFVLNGPPGGWDWDGVEPILVGGAAGPPVHIEPSALVALSAWVAFLRKRDRRVTIAENLKSPYTWRTGLLAALIGRTALSQSVSPTPDFYPLCSVAGEEGIGAVCTGVIQTLQIKGQQAIQALGSSIREILQNAEDHSESTTPTAFAAGHFRTQRRVTFAVADTGVGIRSTLLRKHVLLPEEDDAVAIEKAIQPRITGAGKPGVPKAPHNAGLGLHTTRMFARDCRGAMMVWSGEGCFREPSHEASEFTIVPRWRGTLVCVTLYPERSGLFALTPRGAGSTGTEEVHFGPPPTGAVVFRPPVDSIGFAASKAWCCEAQPGLHEALAVGRDVCLDFAGALYTTQSALHALLFQSLDQLGPAAASRLHVVKAGKQIEAVIRLVVNYALSDDPASDTGSSPP